MIEDQVDAWPGHQRDEPLQQFRKQKAIGIIDRSLASFRARLHNFVAGRKHRSFQPPAHSDVGHPERGSERKLGQFTPLERAGQPAEVAQAALFLASDEASYVNGHALVVDGGLTASVPFVPPHK